MNELHLADMSFVGVGQQQVIKGSRHDRKDWIRDSATSRAT
jgi:hypothetical protein